MSEEKVAEDLRSVALVMKDRGIELEVSEREPIILALRILRNWLEVLAEYEATKAQRLRVGDSVSPLSPTVYECVVAAFLKTRQAKEAVAVLVEMERHEISPSLATYHLIAKDAAIRNDLATAKDILDRLARADVLITASSIAIFAVAFRKDPPLLDRLELLARQHNLDSYRESTDFAEATVTLLAHMGVVDEAYDRLMAAKDRHPFQYAKLLAMYTAVIRSLLRQTRNMDRAEKMADGLFTDMKESGIRPNLRTFTVLLHGYIKRGALAKAIYVYEELVSAGLEPDSTVFNLLLRACVLHGDLGKMEEIYTRLIDRGLRPTLQMLTSLMTGFIWFGKVEKAVSIFENELGRSHLAPDLVCYNVLILGYGLRGNTEGCIHWWNRMLEAGLAPDAVSYTIFLQTLSKAGDTSVETIFQRVFTTEIEPDRQAYGLLVQDRVRRGELPAATQLFLKLLAEGMDMPSATAAVLIKAHHLANDDPIARDLVKRFAETGSVLSAQIYVIFMRILLKGRQAADVIRLWQGMEKAGIEPTPAIHREVIRAFTMERKPEGIWAVAQEMRGRRTFWNGWRNVVQALATLPKASSYLKLTCQAIAEDGVPLDLPLCDSVIAALIAIEEGEALLEFWTYCLSPLGGEIARKGFKTRRRLHRFVLGFDDPKFVERFAELSIRMEQFADWQDLVIFMRHRGDAPTLVKWWDRVARYSGSRQADALRLLDTLRGAVWSCVSFDAKIVADSHADTLVDTRSTADIVTAQTMFSMALALPQTGQKELGRITDLLLCDGSSDLVFLCWQDLLQAIRSPDDLHRLCDTLSSFLKTAFIARRDATLGHRLWASLQSFLPTTSSSHIQPLYVPMEVVKTYLRCLAFCEDVDGMVHLATRTLATGYTLKLGKGATEIVNATIDLVSKKCPERTREVATFWQERDQR